MNQSRTTTKQNIEIRFYFTPRSAKKLLERWRREMWRMKPYSFVDHYFIKSRSQAKIRRWRSSHRPGIEIIFVERRNGVKTEKTRSAQSFLAASKELKLLGFKPRLKILKKKAWLVSKRSMPTYAFEYVPGLGWTGEIEIPVREKGKIADRILELKRMGATGFTRKSMLQLMEERLKDK